MSSDYAVDVRNIGKCYQIYSNPRDRLKQFVVPALQRLAGATPTRYYRDFWALNDISFTLKKGETLGIIGRNGSGKSTLLQIICGTLNPSAGETRTNGRLAALLELGSGFNPEFTGRENVYLNAGVLGLTRHETDERFESIEAFADIGQFIDQPVKTYSSGMMVRLAFAVIAHVDADILVIDEALAVGDAVFTQKCMRFIRAYQKRGTLLFVSHDMGSVVSLCSRAIWLDGGVLQLAGDAKDVSQAYLKHTLQSVYGSDAALETVGIGDEDVPAQLPTEPTASGAAPALDYGSRYEVADNLGNATGFRTGDAELLSVTCENLSNPGELLLAGGERVRVAVTAKATQPLERPILGFVFNDRLGQALFGENTLSFTDAVPSRVEAGETFRAEFVFRLPMLPNGEYAVFASVADGDLYSNVQHHLLHDALIVRVSSSKVRWGLVGVPFERVSMKVSNE